MTTKQKDKIAIGIVAVAGLSFLLYPLVASDVKEFINRAKAGFPADRNAGIMIR